MSLAEKLALIAATTALFSTVIGPVTTFLIAKKQIKATLISTSRKQNIDNFIQELAEYFSVFSEWFFVMGISGQDPRAITPAGSAPPTDIHNYLRIQSLLVKRRSRISLLHYIDPNMIEKLIQNLIAMERCKKYDDLKPIQEQAFKIARTITSGQWELIQKGK